MTHVGKIKVRLLITNNKNYVSVHSWHVLFGLILRF